VNRLIETKDARDVALRTTYDVGRPTLNEQVFPDRTEKRSQWTYDEVDHGKGPAASVTRWMGGGARTSSVMSYDRAGHPASTQLVIPGTEKGIAGTYLTTVRYNPDGSLQGTGLPAAGAKDTPGYIGAETVLHEYDDFGRIKSTEVRGTRGRVTTSRTRSTRSTVSRNSSDSAVKASAPGCRCSTKRTPGVAGFHPAELVAPPVVGGLGVLQLPADVGHVLALRQG
jgi:hypothetical protein